MRPFILERAKDVVQTAHANYPTGSGQTDAPAQFLAGGTTLIDLMKLDVLVPRQVIDINPMTAEHSAIEETASGLRFGAMATMAGAADHPAVLSNYPVIAQSLQLAASAQLRNMATLGGNVLQRTRCPYYRDPSYAACNKRRPGSGCSALEGVNHNHAILGTDSSCISQYPGDFGVALAALAAEVELLGPDGPRVIPFETLHRPLGGAPHIETTLKPGELITAIQVPAGPWTRRSLYLKIRDRESYEFAISSAAVALEQEAGVVRAARIGLGGMAYRPWRSHEAEAALVGKPLTEANAEACAHAALAGAVTHGGNAYKPELARRALVRALLQTAAMEA